MYVYRTTGFTLTYLFAGTSYTLSNIFLMVTCTTWYQKAIYDRFSIKKILVHHKVIAENFKLNFTAKNSFYALGNGDFLKSSAFSDSEALLKCEKWLEQVPARIYFSMLLHYTISPYVLDKQNFGNL